MSSKILELNNVSKIYGNLKALADINLSVNSGDWLSIMGPSGSGKTTMINIIGCMDTPSTGSVILDGVDISKESAANLTRIRRDKIGLIFQQFHLISYLTAVENVMVAQYYHSMPDESEALEALAKVGQSKSSSGAIIRRRTAESMHCQSVNQLAADFTRRRTNR